MIEYKDQLRVCGCSVLRAAPQAEHQYMIDKLWAKAGHVIAEELCKHQGDKLVFRAKLTTHNPTYEDFVHYEVRFEIDNVRETTYALMELPTYSPPTIREALHHKWNQLRKFIRGH